MTIEPHFEIDFNRALSSRFAPREKRQSLRLLSALDSELAKIRYQTSDPLLQRIRTQFWREALFEQDGGGHALARQMIDCFATAPSLFAELEQLIDVHEEFQDREPSFETYKAEYSQRQGVLFQLATMCLGGREGIMPRAFYEQCGRAYGSAQLLCQKAPELHDQTIYLEELLDQTQNAYAEMKQDLLVIDQPVRIAVLPLALVPPYLDLFQTSDRAGSQPIDLHPVRKAWVLWRAARNGFK